MGWTRYPGRVARDRRRPSLEHLETRQLLSTVRPASDPSNLNADGSTNFDQLIGASAARAAYQVDGSGMSVAVIDTGVNYNHPALGGGLGMGTGHKVIAGVDFTGSPNGVLPTWQHGTGVAGVIDSTDPNHLGVAPGAEVVALRVFGDDNTGSFANIARALDWVVQHHSEYNITAVNLSIADGGNYVSNQFGQDGGVGQKITEDVGLLAKQDIPVVVAAGNSFNGRSTGQGMGFPAIIPGTISVTATDASDKLASNAQRLGAARGGALATTIAAPGIAITGPSSGNSFSSEDGTSFAAPQVTGSVVLLQQMYQKAYHTLPTIDQLDQLLQQGAVTVHDGVTGIDVGRINVLKSAQILSQQIANSNSGTGGGSGSGDGSGSTTPVVPVQPQTLVIFNGNSLGYYPTSVLQSRYPNLFAFLKKPVTSLRIYSSKGIAPDLGVSKPSGTVAVALATRSKAAPHQTATTTTAAEKGHTKAVARPLQVVHTRSTSMKAPSFLGSLFPSRR